MTFWGEREDGTKLLLGDPQEVQLLYDADAPASQLLAVFPGEDLWGPLVRVWVYGEKEVLYGGVVDEQTSFWEEEGKRVELVCRSWEGVLLDNEAQPGTWRGPSLESLWRLYIQPLGFHTLVGDREPKPGEWCVEKGVSCWQVLADFCREYLGTTPYIDGEGVVHCEGIQPTVRQGGAVLSAQLRRSSCKRLSAVWQQSCRGTYDTPFYNRQAKGVVRQRYVSRESGRDPRALLQEGEEEYLLLTVELAGEHWPVAGQRMAVEIPGLGQLPPCPVVSARYLRRPDGERTRLVLQGGEQLCG